MRYTGCGTIRGDADVQPDSGNLYTVAECDDQHQHVGGNDPVYDEWKHAERDGWNGLQQRDHGQRHHHDQGHCLRIWVYRQAGGRGQLRDQQLVQRGMAPSQGDHTQLQPGSWGLRLLSNYPLLYSVTDTDVAAAAQSSGNDILFTASDGVTKLNHEIEAYTSSTGQLTAWVQVPTLSAEVNTTIYIYYGNNSAANQQNPSGVWDSNYAAVYHLASGSTLSANDSTSHGYNGTLVNSPT